MQNELHVHVPGILIFKIITSVGQVQCEERGCLFPNVEWTAVLFHDLQVHSHWHHQPCRSRSISEHLTASTNVETRGSLSASSPQPPLSSPFPLVTDWQSSLIVMVAIVLMVSFLLLQWRYSPGWALACFTIRFQASWSLHSFIPIFLRSVDTSSSHLIFRLPLRLVACSFPYIFFGIAVSCILSVRPSHRILWHFINLTMFSPLIIASNSLFRRILHNSFYFTGPYIFRSILLSNTAYSLSSPTVSVHDCEPQVTAGRTDVRYICSLLFLDVRLLLTGCLFA